MKVFGWRAWLGGRVGASDAVRQSVTRELDDRLYLTVKDYYDDKCDIPSKVMDSVDTVFYGDPEP